MALCKQSNVSQLRDLICIAIIGGSSFAGDNKKSVVRNEPSAIGRGGFGTEEQPVLGQFEIQFIAHHSGLHANPAALLVDRDDPIEVRRQIDDQPVADDLPGEGCSCRAENDSCRVAPQRG